MKQNLSQSPTDAENLAASHNAFKEIHKLLWDYPIQASEAVKFARLLTFLSNLIEDTKPEAQNEEAK